MAWSQSSKLHRYKHYLKFLFEKFDLKCYFCGRRLDPDAFFPQKSKQQLDEYLIHHIDGNHDNERAENKVFVHRSCHGEYNWKVRKGLKKKGTK
jgi:hypothetical protein